MTTMTTAPTLLPLVRSAAHRGDGFLVPAGTSAARRKRITFEAPPVKGRHAVAARVTAATTVAALGASSVTSIALMMGLGR